MKTSREHAGPAGAARPTVCRGGAHAGTPGVRLGRCPGNGRFRAHARRALMIARGAALAALALACTTPPARADSTVWTNRGGGYWSVPGNWSPNTPPGPGTNALLTSDSGNTSYTVTNDITDNACAGLTICNPTNAGVHTLLSAANALFASGDAVVGRNGSLVVSNATVSIGGAATISNAGAVYVLSGAVLNVGGTDRETAGASLATLTNLAGGILELGQPGGSSSNYFVSFLNASTATVGLVNQGSLRNRDGHYIASRIHANVFNDTGGVIWTRTLIETMELHQLCTNRGQILIGNVTSGLTVTNGDVANEGLISNPGGGFRISNGSLYNASNGVVLIYGTSSQGALWSRSTLNDGVLIVSNMSGSSGGYRDMGGPITNRGTMLLYRSYPGSNIRDTLYASNIVNLSFIYAVGSFGTPVTNAIAGNMVRSPILNQRGGVISATNGTVFVLTDIRNSGTLAVHSNSVLAVGYAAAGPGRIDVGGLAFTNDGAIALENGDLAVARLVAVAGSELRGRGEIGRVTLSNLVSASGATTNFARQFAVRGVANSGAIRPGGTLNAGAISNLPGGVLAGYGALRSMDTAAFYADEALVLTNINRGHRIFNATGAVLMADGGVLDLENGFEGDRQSGTIGATNGGVLRIGGGSQPLANDGVIRLSNGRLECGDLTLTNGSVVVDLDHVAADAGCLMLASNVTLGGTGELVLSGTGRRTVLILHTGARAGVFSSVTGVPPGFRVSYDLDGRVELAPAIGEVITVR